MLFVSYEELQQHINHNCNIPSSALDDVVKYEFAFSCDPENADYCKKRGCQDFCHHTLNPDAAKNFDLISDQPTRKKYFENQKSGWIPVVTRPMTEDEYKEYEENVGWLDESDRYLFVGQMPEDGQEILISTKYGVSFDMCLYDPEYGYGLDNHDDWDGVLAWMPLPKPYEKEGDPGVDIPAEEERS